MSWFLLFPGVAEMIADYLDAWDADEKMMELSERILEDKKVPWQGGLARRWKTSREEIAKEVAQLESSLAEAREECDAFKLLYQLSNKPVDATQEEIIAAHQIVQAHFQAGGDDET